MTVGLRGHEVALHRHGATVEPNRSWRPDDGDVDRGEGVVAMEVRVARVHDPRTARDGYRVLVDRLWPRGISKAVADLDEWCREVAPSAPLRRWYGHVPDRFPEFRQRYRTVLSTGEAATAVERLRRLGREQTLTLLTGSRDSATSNAAVLAEALTGRL